MRPVREHATSNGQTYTVTSPTWGRRALFSTDAWAKNLCARGQQYPYSPSRGGLELDCVPQGLKASGLDELAAARLEGLPFQSETPGGAPDHRVSREGLPDQKVKQLKVGRIKGKHLKACCITAKVHLGGMRPRLFQRTTNCIVPQRTDISKILVLGSGPIVIGQSAELDYSGAHACKAFGPAPQGLKPGRNSESCGAPEGAPLQGVPEAEYKLGQGGRLYCESISCGSRRAVPS